MSGTKVSQTRASRVPAAASESNVPDPTMPATATLGPMAGLLNVTGGISWSFAATPPYGTKLTLRDNGIIKRTWFVSAGGPGQLRLEPPICNADVNTSIVLTLDGLGSGIPSTVNFDSAWTETP